MCLSLQMTDGTWSYQLCSKLVGLSQEGSTRLQVTLAKVDQTTLIFLSPGYWHILIFETKLTAYLDANWRTKCVCFTMKTSWKTTVGVLNDLLMATDNDHIPESAAFRSNGVVKLEDRECHCIKRRSTAYYRSIDLYSASDPGICTWGGINHNGMCEMCLTQSILKANDACRAPMVVLLRRYAKRPGWECDRTIPELKETGRLNPFSTSLKKSPMIKNVFNNSPIPYDNAYYLKDTDWRKWSQEKVLS